MTQPTLKQIEDLGAAIYSETARLNAEPSVGRSDSGASPKQERLEELRIAAEFNGVALKSARKRAGDTH